MIKFNDGPAHGVTLSLQRTPIFLRVVMDGDGKFDALDQLEDEPEKTEQLFVYILRGEVGRAFIDGTDKNGRRTGWMTMIADYYFFPDQPADEAMRVTKNWRAWTEEQGKKL